MNSLDYFHDAMATTFSLKITNTPEIIAEHVAGLCFQRIDDLEMKLSRFIPDSDIARINKMKAGDELMLEDEVYDCLKQAIQISKETNGFFDVGTAEFSDIYRGFQSGILNEYEFTKAINAALAEKKEGSLYLNPDISMIHCIKEGLKIDLGGIGKGFAIDILSEICLENEVSDFTIDAGKSTVLVNTSQKKSFQLNAREEQKSIQINRGSVSSSGTGQQGYHIFNPATGENEFRLYDRVWVCCVNACKSDAYATAFYNMNADQIDTVIEENKAIKWVAISNRGKIKYIYKEEKQLL